MHFLPVRFFCFVFYSISVADLNDLRIAHHSVCREISRRYRRDKLRLLRDFISSSVFFVANSFVDEISLCFVRERSPKSHKISTSATNSVRKANHSAESIPPQMLKTGWRIGPKTSTLPWQCSQCTFLNHDDCPRCLMCKGMRPRTVLEL